MSMQQRLPEARQRRSRYVSLVWLVPIAAAAIVAWLGVRTLWDRGPLVTITFNSADGLEAGRTKVRHKDVEIGTVESVALSRDLSRVVVTARMDRKVAAHVTDSAKFWVVRPRLSAAGISGLSTIVSGSYIEMEPGAGGTPRSHFKGLEEPPIEPPTQPGKRFTLTAEKLGSLGHGSPIYYHGIITGEVLGYELAKSADHVQIEVYVRAPYDALVHRETRFWNASGFSISAGPQGVRANVESLQALVVGGIAFDDAPSVRRTPPSPAGATFRLYDDEASADAEPLGQKILFLVNFPGVVRGLSNGAPVELKGITVGQVIDVHLDYDEKTGTLATPATFELDPSRLGLDAVTKPAGGDYAPVVYDMIGRLVREGYRARLATSSLLTGQRVVSLEPDPDAPPAALAMSGAHPEVPTSSGGDLDSLTQSAAQLMRTAQQLIRHVDKLVGGKRMDHTLQSLDRLLANTDHLTAKDLPTLIATLRQTAAAATRTLDTTGRALGGSGQRGGDLQGMMHELTEAARSVRSLADFLEAHPEALLQGRSGSGP